MAHAVQKIRVRVVIFKIQPVLSNSRAQKPRPTVGTPPYFCTMMRTLFSGVVMALLLLPATLSAQSEGFNMNMSIDADGEQMNMNISIDGEGDQMNMDVQMDGMHMEQDMQMDTQTEGWGNAAAPAAAPAPSGPLPMNDLIFNRYLNEVKSKDFESSKLATAKSPLRGQYLTAEQVAEVMRAFDFEATRLEFAILAHPRCVDPSNYYLTYGAFDFELSIEELEEGIAE